MYIIAAVFSKYCFIKKSMSKILVDKVVGLFPGQLHVIGWFLSRDVVGKHWRSKTCLISPLCVFICMVG